MKKIAFIKIFISISILLSFPIFTVFAQQSVESNKVITRVGDAPEDRRPTQPSTKPKETKPGNLGLAVSCPVGDSFRVTCGTAADPSGSCGHGGIGYAAICNPYYYACVGSRYSDALYKSLDVVVPGKASAPVYLPFVNGESITWNIVQFMVPIGRGAEWGYKNVYQGEYNNQQIRLDLTHLNGDTNKEFTLKSGALVGTYNAGVDHVHTAIAVSGRWVEPRSDVGMCAN